jgi:NlpC/P60 family
MAATDFGDEQSPLLASDGMIDAIATTALLTLVNQVSGTPYRTGGDSPAGTDCSGLVSWVANAASGRPIYGDRFHTGNEEQALLARGFKYGTEPGALNIGWNSGHTAVTLPDGTPVSSGESGSGVRIGGGGAFQPQFTRHMYLPLAQDEPATDPQAPQAPPADPFAPAPPAPGPADLPAVEGADAQLLPPPGAEVPPPPASEVPPAPDAGPVAI